MKLKCLNIDECGYSENISLEDLNEINDFKCKNCLSMALPYTNNHKPIIYENSKDFLKKSENLLAIIHNLLNDVAR